MGSLAVSYSRVSSKEQQEGYSIAAQQESIRDYAKRQDFKITQEFTDVESASKSGRTNFGKMLAFLEANPDVKIILVEKTDRLYRNLRDYIVLDDLMQDLDVEIHLVKESQIVRKDSRSDTKFIHGLNVLQAKKYTDNLSEEVKKGMLQKAKQGKFPGGNIPLGYLLDKNINEIYPDPLRSHLIVEMFNLYASNKISLRGLVSWAREKSLTMPKSGNNVTKCQIERILKNPFYYGDFRWAGKIFKGDHAPIISRLLFEAVQSAFRSHNKPQLNKKTFAFGNIMTCSLCGCNITAEIKKGMYTYYHCTGMRGGNHIVYVPENKIANQFRSYLEPLHLNDHEVSQILKGLEQNHRQKSKSAEHDNARLQARITQLETWLEKAYIDKLEGIISEEQWSLHTSKWEHEKAQLQRFLSTDRRPNDEILYTAKELLELLQVIPQLWDTRNNFERRELVDLLYSNCQLNGRSLCLTYKKPFDDIVEGIQNQKWRG